MGLRGIGSHPLSRRGSPIDRTPPQRPNRIPHEAEMSLRYGELAERPAFAGEEERRAAWFHHRDRLLHIAATAGAPPVGGISKARFRIRVMAIMRRRRCLKPGY